MKISNKLLVIGGFLIFSLFVLMSTSNADSHLYLDNLEFQAQITEYGDMEVKEIWDINIQETNTLYKTFIKDSSKYSEIENVEVKDITNSYERDLTQSYTWQYHMEEDEYFGGTNDGKFEIAWGVGLDNSSEKRKYEISYTVRDVISKFDDYAQLYWQFVGDDFEISAEKVKGTILLPSNAETEDDILVWGHTEDLNGEIYATDTDKIEFVLNDFRGGKYIEIRTLFPTSMITSANKVENTEIKETVINEETVWANEANARREAEKNKKIIIAIVADIIALILAVLLIISIIKRIKKNKTKVKLEPTIKLDYFREIPRESATPGEALLLHKKQKAEFGSDQIGKIFSATLLDLALKKVVEFETVKDKKDSIKIKIINSEPKLKGEEKEIFDFLKAACTENNEILVKELEKYIKKKYEKVIKLKEQIDTLVLKDLQEEKIINAVENEEYGKCRAYITLNIVGIIASIITAIILMTETSNLVLIGMIPFIIVFIINMITLKQSLSKINVYSKEGLDEIEKWQGLKKFMEDFSMLDKREVPELVIWESFLVYATVFGIADKVLKQLKIVYPDLERNMDLATYSYMNLMIHTNFDSSFSNSISSAMSTAYSSSTGGGGGFSSGGGGGRRPAVVAVVDKSHHTIANIEVKKEL